MIICLEMLFQVYCSNYSTGYLLLKQTDETGSWYMFPTQAQAHKAQIAQIELFFMEKDMKKLTFWIQEVEILSPTSLHPRLILKCIFGRLWDGGASLPSMGLPLSIIHSAVVNLRIIFPF